MEKILQINLGAVGQIPLGQGRCYVVNGHDIAVFCSRNRKFFAVENRCPHRGGPLSDGVIGEDRVVCPLHGHKFDLTTGKGSEPHECIQVFRVREENGDLWIEYPMSLLNFSSQSKADITDLMKEN